MYINPEFTLPFEMGPMTQITIGLTSAFDLNRKAGYSYSYTETAYAADEDDDNSTDYIEKETTTVENDGATEMEFGIFVNPSFEWSMWEDKVAFAVDPTFGVNYSYVNEGKIRKTTKYEDDRTEETETIMDTQTSSEYTNTITPYLDVAVGSLVRALDWLELRAGISYGMYWQNDITTTSYKLIGGKSTSEADYTFTSKFDVYAGLGFIFGEDFFIDVYAQFGHDDTEIAFADSSTSENIVADEDNFINNKSFGVQLSYRF